MSKIIKIFTFATIMSVIVGFLLTLASVSLKDMQQANILLDKQKKILTSLGIMDKNKEYTKEEILKIYKTNVKEQYINDNGDLSDTKTSDSDKFIYVVYKDGKIYRYSIHFSVYGLWSYIKGYIGLQGDGNTISGFTVYNHGETPGLGAEVEKEWFSNMVIGKKITNKNHKFVSIDAIKGGVKNKYSPEDAINYIDAISGSTITSKGVTNGLRKILKEYEPLSKKLRGQE